MKSIFTLALIIFLTSCSSVPKLPHAPKVFEVKVEVPVRCLGTLPEKPKLITDAELIILSPGAFVTELHIDRLKRDMYMAQIEAAVEPCKSLGL